MTFGMNARSDRFGEISPLALSPALMEMGYEVASFLSCCDNVP